MTVEADHAKSAETAEYIENGYHRSTIMNTLHLNFINLFLMLLRFSGNRR
jgi:FtsH-binding integral membrane protein